MTEPVYDGMPGYEREFRIRKPGPKVAWWGQIICGGACNDDYARIVIYHQTSSRWVKLQAAAMRSFKSAEEAIGGKLLLTGSWRSCALQSQLYASDHSRYAAPWTTAHCRGLAIDVDTEQSASRLKEIKRALLWRGWHQARPVDEPWHYSFGIQV